MRYWLFCLLMLCSGGYLFAQSSIFDALSVTEPLKGTVTIKQSWEIRTLVGRPSVDEKIEMDGDKRFILMPGYRIQVFAGNLRTSKEEAESKEKQINTLFTNVPTYKIYNAPFWRLRVGDYITYEEAFSMLCKLVEAFPAFKKEIQILKDEEVRVPLN